MKKFVVKLILLISFMTPSFTLANDASCSAFGFKADSNYIETMNKEAQSMKQIVPMVLSEEFGDIQFCVHSSIEQNFMISDGFRTIIQDLKTGITSFYAKGSPTNPSKCLSSSFKAYSPSNGKC